VTYDETVMLRPMSPSRTGGNFPEIGFRHNFLSWMKLFGLMLPFSFLQNLPDTCPLTRRGLGIMANFRGLDTWVLTGKSMPVLSSNGRSVVTASY